MNFTYNQIKANGNLHSPKYKNYPTNRSILEIMPCYRTGKLMNPKCKQRVISKGLESIVVLLECSHMIMPQDLISASFLKLS